MITDHTCISITCDTCQEVAGDYWCRRVNCQHCEQQQVRP